MLTWGTPDGDVKSSEKSADVLYGWPLVECCRSKHPLKWKTITSKLAYLAQSVLMKQCCKYPAAEF